MTKNSFRLPVVIRRVSSNWRIAAILSLAASRPPPPNFLPLARTTWRDDSYSRRVFLRFSVSSGLPGIWNLRTMPRWIRELQLAATQFPGLSYSAFFSSYYESLKIGT